MENRENLSTDIERVTIFKTVPRSVFQRSFAFGFENGFFTFEPLQNLIRRRERNAGRLNNLRGGIVTVPNGG